MVAHPQSHAPKFGHAHDPRTAVHRPKRAGGVIRVVPEGLTPTWNVYLWSLVCVLGVRTIGIIAGVVFMGKS